MIVLTRFLIFLANLCILTYVYQLEMNKCELSDNWRRDFIFYYSLIYIFSVVSFCIMPEFFYQNLQVTICLKVILGVLLLFNIYCLYTYSEMLDKLVDKCDSAKTNANRFMKFFSIFYVVVLVLVFAYLIVYYTNMEFKDLKGTGKRRILTNNNLEKILVIEKI